MPFSTFDLFIPVKSDIVTFASDFYRLTIENGGTWFAIASFTHTHVATQRIEDQIKCSVILPHVIIIRDMTRLREVMGNHVPLTAGFIHIRNRIHDFAHSDGSSSAASGLLANKRRNIVPFRIKQIRWIWFTWHVCILPSIDVFPNGYSTLSGRNAQI